MSCTAGLLFTTTTTISPACTYTSQWLHDLMVVDVKQDRGFYGLPSQVLPQQSCTLWITTHPSPQRARSGLTLSYDHGLENFVMSEFYSALTASHQTLIQSLAMFEYTCVRFQLTDLTVCFVYNFHLRQVVTHSRFRTLIETRGRVNRKSRLPSMHALQSGKLKPGVSLMTGRQTFLSHMQRPTDRKHG